MRGVPALPRGDRRTRPRVPLDLPITLRKGDLHLPGRTRDLDQQGLSVNVRTAGGLAPGDRVAFSLPLRHLRPEGPGTLDGTAIVLRLEAAGDDTLVALQAEWLTTTPEAPVDANPATSRTSEGPARRARAETGGSDA